ncbi:MAG: hypothetical protein R2752_00405 [Vicinamibacterales bacterium]
MPGRRPARRIGPALGLALAVAAGPAGAQVPADPGTAAVRPVAVGGELTASLAPADTDAFFNYTDYEHDTLRIARLRLLAEWRPHPRLSFAGELRTENGDGLDAAAWYVRWRPLAGHDLTIQAGRLPPLLGAYPRRAYGRDNLVAGAPLAYQYLTALRPDALPRTVADLLRMRGRGWQPSYPLGSATLAPGVPLVSAFRWDTGVQATWRHGWAELSGAVTAGSAAVPVVGETNGGRQWSGRLAVAPPGGPALGVSASTGAWIDDDVLALLPPGVDASHDERVVGLDAEYGVGRWLMRAEWTRAAFDLPLAGGTGPALSLVSHAVFGEARYRWHPRWQAAVRAETLNFSRVVRPVDGARVTWDAPVRRVEVSVGYRATRRLELRAGWQHDWRDGGRVRERGYPVASLLYWF